MTTSLVLAGGGVTGIAWETGVLLGLRDSGIDMTALVDRVIGTSAGSVVGAQLLGGTDLADLYAAQVADEHHEMNPDLDLDLLARVFGLMEDGGTSSDQQRREIGRLALGARTVDEATRRRVIEHRLAGIDWPTTELVVTAIDAESGEFVTWTRTSGVSLIDAVASSCAVPGVWPCVSIAGRRFYDGGLRNGTNAFLAAGSREVVVIAPRIAGPSPSADAEVEQLRRDGTIVRYIQSDHETTAAVGINSLDPAFRRPAAEHGRRQGRLMAALFDE
ncbi:MAG: patatin-like phospholipase family protein [Ilumatobacteraceae bacterium]